MISRDPWDMIACDITVWTNDCTKHVKGIGLNYVCRVS